MKKDEQNIRKKDHVPSLRMSTIRGVLSQPALADATNLLSIKPKSTM
jgi:hypothetical protein